MTTPLIPPLIPGLPPMATTPQLWLARYVCHRDGAVMATAAIDVMPGQDPASVATRIAANRFGADFDIVLFPVKGATQARFTTANRNRLLTHEEMKAL